MILQSGIGGEKSKLAQARLREVCCFSAPFARRLHPSLSLSMPIRAIRGLFLNFYAQTPEIYLTTNRTNFHE
jgi:hypothetical protein